MLLSTNVRFSFQKLWKKDTEMVSVRMGFIDGYWADTDTEKNKSN
jgi:hypothetical protein